MKKRFNLFQILGFVLLISGLGLLLYSQIRTGTGRHTASEVVEQIEGILPRRTQGIRDTYTDMDMPALQIGNEDFCALLEIPDYGVTLPVYNRWEPEKRAFYPCRFDGTCYDGSLIIGGADQPGQLDFCGRIQTETRVTVTDMAGEVFHYSVSRIDRSRSAEAEKLAREAADLVLFVRDSQTLDYLIVSCVMA